MVILYALLQAVIISIVIIIAICILILLVKRKFKNKSGFATKSEAKQAGIIAYNEYLNTGHSFKPKTMSYSDYLDYWMKEHCEINIGLQLQE